MLYKDIVGIRIAESGRLGLSLDFVAVSFGCACPQIICLRRTHDVEAVGLPLLWKTSDFGIRGKKTTWFSDV